jgi:hypothetical protein
MFPKLKFIYSFEDEGMGFAAIETYQDGELVEEREMKNSTSKDPVLRSVRNKLRIPDNMGEMIAGQ